MNALRLAWTSLVHYRRQHTGALLATAVGTAVLTGSLLAGDSVRDSLRRLSLQKLGATEWTVQSAEGSFRAALAPALASALPAEAAPLWLSPGTASLPDRQAVAPRVQIAGVEPSFFPLGRAAPTVDALRPGEALVNRALAERLGARVGDDLVLRLEKPGALPREAAFSPTDDATATLRLRVRGLLGPEQFGRFSLRLGQTDEPTVFVALGELTDRLERPGRANTLLLASPATGPSLTKDRLEKALRAAMELTDYELTLRPSRDGREAILATPQVFLSDAAAQAAAEQSFAAREILTYLVNAIEAEGRAVPYSFVTGAGAPWVPADLADDEIVLNAWLARELRAAPGDEVRLRYWTLSTYRLLEEREATFRVRSIAPMAGAYADPLLTPDLPGLSDATSCRDWNSSLPLDLRRLRPADEAYWETYRGTPKAFIGLKAAQRLWSNRFGRLTSVRLPLEGETIVALGQRLRDRLTPGEAGLHVLPIRDLALEAGRGAVDFGQLLLGMSFFLMASALLLAGMLHAFGVETRAPEIGLLHAVGFSSRRVLGLMALESVGPALAGSLLGGLLGLGYTGAVLAALRTVWHGAVGMSALQLSVHVGSLTGGTAGGLLMALAAMALAARKQSRRTGLSVQADAQDAGARTPSRRRIGLFLGLAAGSVVAAAVLAGTGGQAGAAGQAGLFFGAGALLLLGGAAGGYAGLGAWARAARSAKPGWAMLGPRNCTRRPGASLAVAALLACGLFLVIAVGANRQAATPHPEARASGTGGFALYGETARPLAHDLNRPEGRAFYTLDGKLPEGCAFLGLRLRAGDDASCLNLTRVAQPRLLGVPVDELSGRNAFRFAQRLGPTPDAPEANPWALLQTPLPDGAIPAVADAAVITWSLQKKLGDEIVLADGRGQPLRLKLVGALEPSVFQGSVLISEEAFLRAFPDDGGARVLLVDAPAGAAPEVARVLAYALQDLGLDLTSAGDRLEQFQIVTHTYLAIFLALGGLGLLLGTVGLGLVVARHVLQRRGELGLLRAVGFAPWQLTGLVLWEHGLLIAAGLVFGLLAALLAIAPALRASSAPIPWRALLLTLAGMAASGLIWTWLAARTAHRRPLLDALQEE